MINYIIEKKFVETAMNKIKVNHIHKDDLRQEVYLILASKQNLKEIPKEKLEAYVMVIVKNQYNSTTSPFWQIHRKFEASSSEFNEETCGLFDDTDEESIDNYEVNLDWNYDINDDDKENFIKAIIHFEFDEEVTEKLGVYIQYRRSKLTKENGNALVATRLNVHEKSVPRIILPLIRKIKDVYSKYDYKEYVELKLRENGYS